MGQVLKNRDDRMKTELKRAMRENQVIQKDLSNLLKVSEKTFNTKLNAPHKFLVGELLLICEYLGVVIDMEYMGDEDANNEDANNENEEND